MAASFFFYDVETSGFDARAARIMQFAGQRTDMDLQPIGDPVNVLIKLTPDVLPDPEAVLVTGITPQATLADGISEAEFLKYFYAEIVAPDTIFLGYNSVRFDDEFMRFLHYRNFYDAYRWQWSDGCSRWDLLDVVRMTRALRPEGIKWPFDSSGAPSNRLGLLTAVNQIDHVGAHDALADVRATIAMARLIKDKQPKLFSYLLDMRDKKKVAKLAQSGQPFVYASGKYSSEFEKTTVVASLAPHPKKQGMLVYDLRYDPDEFTQLSAEQLAERWKWVKEPTSSRLPIKTLQFNRCPAIAPLSVLNAAAETRIKLDKKTAEVHLVQLKSAHNFPEKVLKALEILDNQQQVSMLAHEQEVDAGLYDGFFDAHDSGLLPVIRIANPAELTSFVSELHDPRLKALLPLYKARNYPASLTPEERSTWDAFCQQRIIGTKDRSPLERYMRRLEELTERATTDAERYLIQELRLYGESIMPVELT